MLLPQVHLDHLCTPLAHLGSWPPPPLNSILVPTLNIFYISFKQLLFNY